MATQDVSDEVLRTQHGFALKQSRPDESARERDLEKSFRQLCKLNGISKMPDIRYRLKDHS